MMISVIITAYNRSDYLKDALRSILNQTLDVDKFETILIKNFPDPFADALSIENKITVIAGGNDSIGSYISKALSIARGEVISFLDDDDAFDRDKLLHVYSSFQSNPKLVYCRNELSIIDAEGKTILESKMPHNDDNNQIILYNSNEALKKAGRHLRWNTSCISVRKLIFDGHEEYLPSMFAGQDLTIFYLAASKNGQMAYDPHRLTLYRLHSNSVTRKIGQNNDFFREWSSLNGMKYLFQQNPIKTDFDKTLSELKIYSVFYGSNIEIRDIKTLLSPYLKTRNIKRSDFKIIILLAIISSLFLLLPKSSFKMIRKIFSTFTHRKVLLN